MTKPILEETQLLGGREVDDIIRNAAANIVRDIGGVTDENFAVIGIQGGGIELSKRLLDKISEVTGKAIKHGTIDISFYRDDLATRGMLPTIKETKITFDITGMSLLLVDDVIFTGRSIKAAIEAVMSFGRPARIKLFCLVDRGGRELPIQPDYCGLRTNATSGVHDQIQVRLYPDKKDSAKEAVVLIKQTENKELT